MKNKKKKKNSPAPGRGSIFLGFLRDWRFELRKRLIGFEVPDMPHFDPESSVFFIDEIKKSKKYLEFGSGGSTVYASKLGKPGMSIEGDRHFHRDVKKKVGDKTSMTLKYVDIGTTRAWGRPRNLEKSAEQLKKWSRYIETPFDTLASTDDFYDLILVDGRFRIACALKVLQEGARRKADFTLMVDDYKPRKKYWTVEKYAERTEMVGRMAVFRIRGGEMIKPPTDGDVSRHIGDVN